MPGADDSLDDMDQTPLGREDMDGTPLSDEQIDEIFKQRMGEGD